MGTFGNIQLTKGVAPKQPLLSNHPVEAEVERSEHPKRERSYDRRTHKRCIKCREVKPLDQFGAHDDTVDGHQSYCYKCKSALGVKRRLKNVKARLRHHMATRIATQLGALAPENLTRDLHEYLGYTLGELVKGLTARLQSDYRKRMSLRDVLNEGWHVDHIYPLSRFNVIVEGEVDWEEFRRCWAIDNLRAIPAEENLAKGAKINLEEPF